MALTIGCHFHEESDQHHPAYVIDHFHNGDNSVLWELAWVALTFVFFMKSQTNTTLPMVIDHSSHDHVDDCLHTAQIAKLEAGHGFREPDKLD